MCNVENHVPCILPFSLSLSLFSPGGIIHFSLPCCCLWVFIPSLVFVFLVCASVGRRVYWGVEISNRLYKRKHELECSVQFDTLVGRGTVVMRCLITNLLIPPCHFSPFFRPLFRPAMSLPFPFSCVLLLRHPQPLFCSFTFDISDDQTWHVADEEPRNA